ncbi:hypothetical protein BDN70DRAFT_803794 [Pholiota conissans]|uniref:Uncharacterized protein n=1 Tax=Pholiota conissans TaxID=109636 RepID=A0A9P6CV19_9AGAR|nr:hypothetical protein BDN70DRAFT_803794 [Pholiota conissans]
MGDAIDLLCRADNPASQKYHRAYTSIPTIDNADPGPCVVVAFFHLLLDVPQASPLPNRFLGYLLGNGLPFVLVPMVEAYRYKGKQHWLLSWPTFWLLMTQVATMGFVLPVYFLLALMTRGQGGGCSEDDKYTVSGEKKVEALTFGLAIGAGLPSLAMIYLNDAFATWIWQFYPILVVSLRYVYLHFRSKNTNTNSAISQHKTPKILRVLYLTCFLVASLTHGFFVWPLIRRGKFRSMYDLLVPLPVSALDTMVHPSILVHNFLKWDYALSAASTLIAMLWSAGSVEQVGYMILWYALAIPVLGPGAACMGVLVWQNLM